MSRHPLDKMAQRELVDEVRLLLDALCDDCLDVAFACGRSRCFSSRVRLLRLAQENPRSIWSTKVMYNIGVRRLARLVRVCPPHGNARARARAFLPTRYEALVPLVADSSTEPAWVVADQFGQIRDTEAVTTEG